jgi:geranylgeranyl pyrophosphate synthase
MQEEYNSKKVYQQRMKEMEITRQQIAAELPILQNIANSKYALLIDDTLITYCFFLLDKRIEKKPLRAYFLQKVGDYVMANEEMTFDAKRQKLLTKLGFIIELIMVIQYLHNQILDGKAGVTSKEKIAQNLVAGNILRELLFDYITTEIGKFDNNTATKTAECVARIFMYVDIGQMMEINYGHYNAYKKNVFPEINSNSQLNQFIDEHIVCVQTVVDEIKEEMPEKKQFIDLYFRRIFLTNVSLFTLATQLICDLLNSSSKKQNELLKFASAYGIALQIANDVGEIVQEEKNQETIGKEKVDAFSDLKNQNITLPFIYHLQKGYKRLIESYLECPKNKAYIIKDYQEQLNQELVDSLSIDNCIAIGKKIAKEAKKHLDENNPTTFLFWNMSQIAEWNSFFISIYKK